MRRPVPALLALVALLTASCAAGEIAYRQDLAQVCPPVYQAVDAVIDGVAQPENEQDLRQAGVMLRELRGALSTDEVRRLVDEAIDDVDGLVADAEAGDPPAATDEDLGEEAGGIITLNEHCLLEEESQFGR